jgi:[NiFe] hydrogenase diaphorase moiety small subunit
MAGEKLVFNVDRVEVEATEGQTIIEACDAAGIYIPRLCHHPDLPPASHCRVCTCKVDGRRATTCTMPVADGMVVENDTSELNGDRRVMIEMLFVEGNHFCPSCERSGDCELQALGYRLGMVAPQLPYLWPKRDVEATHPDIFIDRNRCILCSRCIRASRIADGKSVFGFEGRGIHMRLNVDTKGRLDDTALAAADKAAHVCPVGSIVIKRTGYLVPYGTRRYDQAPIGSDIEAKRPERNASTPAGKRPT